MSVIEFNVINSIVICKVINFVKLQILGFCPKEKVWESLPCYSLLLTICLIQRLFHLFDLTWHLQYACFISSISFQNCLDMLQSGTLERKGLVHRFHVLKWELLLHCNARMQFQSFENNKIALKFNYKCVKVILLCDKNIIYMQKIHR